MDLKPLFDSFYDKLVLRDLVGKVVPGIAFMLSLIAGLIGLDILDHLLSKMTILLWVVVVGFAWLLGFALQGLGEITHILRTHPRGRKAKDSALNTPNAPPWTRASFFNLWAEFHEGASPHERIHAERLNVIKEACGNATISTASAVVFACFGAWMRGIALSSLVPFLFVGLVITALLWQMHITHVERYGEFVFNTIGFRKITGRVESRRCACPPSSNRACSFPAHGFPMSFTSRHAPSSNLLS